MLTDISVQGSKEGVSTSHAQSVGSWASDWPRVTSAVTCLVWGTAQVKSGLIPVVTGHSVGADSAPTQLSSTSNVPKT